MFSELGCEPVTRGTTPEAWKRDQEYLEHRKHGGERDIAFEKKQSGTDKAGDVTVLSQLRQAKAIGL